MMQLHYVPNLADYRQYHGPFVVRFELHSEPIDIGNCWVEEPTLVGWVPDFDDDHPGGMEFVTVAHALESMHLAAQARLFYQLDHRAHVEAYWTHVDDIPF